MPRTPEHRPCGGRAILYYGGYFFVYTKTEADEEFLKFEDIEALTEAEVLAICEETLV